MNEDRNYRLIAALVALTIIACTAIITFGVVYNSANKRRAVTICVTETGQVLECAVGVGSGVKR